MNTPTLTDQRADRIAARATGLGTGLIAFMLTWTLGARITGRLVDAPNSAYAAMIIALIVGTVTTLQVGHRLLVSLHIAIPKPHQDDHATPVSERAGIRS